MNSPVGDVDDADRTLSWTEWVQALSGLARDALLELKEEPPTCQETPMPLSAALKQGEQTTSKEASNTVAPPELSRQEAARYLGVSVETFLEFQREGLLRYRNASPPGSGKPRYRYPVVDLDQLMQQDYRRDVPRSKKSSTRRRNQSKPQTYEHLDLE